MTMRTELLRFNGAVERDPAIDAWMKEHASELGAIAQQWFEVMRKCADEVRELLHDGCPVACRSEEHTSELQSHLNLVCRLLLEKKKKKKRESPVAEPH